MRSDIIFTAVVTRKDVSPLLENRIASLNHCTIYVHVLFSMTLEQSRFIKPSMFTSFFRVSATYNIKHKHIPNRGKTMYRNSSCFMKRKALPMYAHIRNFIINNTLYFRMYIHTVVLDYDIFSLTDTHTPPLILCMTPLFILYMLIHARTIWLEQTVLVPLTPFMLSVSGKNHPKRQLWLLGDAYLIPAFKIRKSKELILFLMHI